MLVSAKNIILKNGNKAVLKSVSVDYAEAFLNAYITQSGETDFLNNYPEEIKYTVEFEQKFIDHVNGSDSKFIIGAFVDEIFVGSLSLMAQNNTKRKHRADLGISILKKYWGMGVGKALMEYAIEQAKNMGVELLCLSVFKENINACNMYKKMGFTQYGELINSAKLKDGKKFTEIFMYKNL